MAKEKYSLTPEHRAQLSPWADRWIANAMSTKPMDDVDRAAMVEAVNGLYDAANLPRPVNVVFVPSPLVGQISSGFAAAIWYLSGNKEIATSAATSDATRAATWDATRAATSDATRAATENATENATEIATWAATGAATWDATENATRAATSDATRAATRAATWAATRAATRDATRAATENATRAATRDATRAATSAATENATRAATRAATENATWDATEIATWAATRAATRAAWAVRLSIEINPQLSDLMLSCARSALNMQNGGNMWSWWPAFLSFFRQIAGLELPEYEKYRHYEAAAIHGGFRWMHPKFCIVSDRPLVLKIDEARRPHCADGPSHLWSDGFAIWHWHGLRIPDTHTWIITDKARLSPDVIDAEPNAELRRVMLEIYGFDRYFADRGAKVVSEDTDGNGHQRRLMSAEVAGEEIRVVEVVNGSMEPDGTRRKFVLGAMPGDTPHEVIAASYGIKPNAYREAVRT